MAWETVSNYYAGQGVVLLGARDTSGGVAKAAGLFEVGNCSELKLMVNTATTEHKETTTGARAIDLRLITEVKANLEVTIENFNAANLSLAMRGHSVASVAGTVTGEVISVYPGMITPFKHIKVSSVVVTKGATPLVLGTDYLLNTEAGSIKFLATGSALAGDVVTVAYSYAAQSEIHGLTQPMQEIWMRFEGLNSADTNKPVVLDVFKFATDPLKELELIGDKVNAFQLAGTVLADLTQGSGTSRYWRQKLLG